MPPWPSRRRRGSSRSPHPRGAPPTTAPRATPALTTGIGAGGGSPCPASSGRAPGPDDPTARSGPSSYRCTMSLSTMRQMVTSPSSAPGPTSPSPRTSTSEPSSSYKRTSGWDRSRVALRKCPPLTAQAVSPGRSHDARSGRRASPKGARKRSPSLTIRNGPLVVTVTDLPLQISPPGRQQWGCPLMTPCSASCRAARSARALPGAA